MASSWRLSLLAVLLAKTCFAQSPDPTELMRKALANYDAREAQAKDFEHMEHVTRRHELTSTVATYEITGVDGREYRRKLPDGKPMTREEEAQADDHKKWLTLDVEVRTGVSMDESRLTGEPSSGFMIVTLSDDLPRLSFQNLLSFFDVRLLQEEFLDGRKNYVLEAHPKHGQRPSKDIESDLRTFKMKIWIDEEDTQIMQVSAIAIRSGVLAYPTSVKVGSRFHHPKYRYAETLLYHTRATYGKGTTIFMKWRKTDDFWLLVNVHVKGVLHGPSYEVPSDENGNPYSELNSYPCESDSVFYGYRRSAATHPALPDAH